MEKAIFYKSNGDVLCECELENDENIISRRKTEFEEYLNKKVRDGKITEQTAKSYISQTSRFFTDLIQKGLLEQNTQKPENLLFTITNLTCLEKIHQAVSKDDYKNDEIYCQINRNCANGQPSACIGNHYIKFLANQEEKISPNNKQFWLYKAGENGEKWEDMYAKGLMGLGWKKLGDLRKYTNKDEIEKALNDLYPRHTTNRRNDKKTNWDFCRKIQIGDIIIVGNGRMEFLGYGEVIGEYFYDSNLDDSFASLRKMNWIKKGKWVWQKSHDNDGGWAIKTLTNITDYTQALNSLLTLLDFNSTIHIAHHNPYKTQPLNQILYGPPGTGKTYNTINKTLEILGEETESKSRQELKELFEAYKAKGQIEFVTFHQNYGYEEFVEGIKPKFNSDKNNDLEYEVKSGIFKKLCKKAKDNLENSQKSKEILQRELDASSAISDFFDDLISKETQLTKTQGGTFSIKEIIDDKVYIQTQDTNSDLKFSISDFEKIILADKDFKSSRELALAVFDEKNQSQVRTYMFQLYKIFKQGNFHKNQTQQTDLIPLTPHILIIDEINRGNVSKIFGELITLIEPSKRIGSDEALQVTLPYSQELFGVPNNLYIIGTMNTADRSITSLDTALRRRFEFVEMMPDHTKLNGKTIDRIELDKLLQAINEKIEFLYDREKTIGHAYLLEVDSLTKLKEVFQNKIIPLLQEYFYNDYEAIQAVFNHNGMIQIKSHTTEDYFKTFINDRGLDEKKIFEITPKNNKNIWDIPSTYIAIYDEQVAKKLRDKTDIPKTQDDGE